MTHTITSTSTKSFRALPNGELYYSPQGLYEFQVNGIAECFVRTTDENGIAVVWDTGTGKSHLAMATAAYLFADGFIDLALVIAEKNKIDEWREDFEKFTALRSHKYHGAGRERRLIKSGIPHVFVTTYETGRNEFLAYENTGSRGKGIRVDGPLVETLGLRDKRILWIFDEVTKIRKRSSENHKAYDYLLRSLRRGPHHQRVLGLTATPMERDIEDAYNIGRIIAPQQMPTVARFDELFVAERDNRGRPRFKPGRQQVFAQMFQQFVIRKRKTDADVLAQFPKRVVEGARITLTPEHAKLYEAVEAICDPPEDGVDERTTAQAEAQERQLYTLLRMIAGHPAAVLHSTSEMAMAVVETVGAERLRAIRSSKTEWLLDKLQMLVRGQGAQVVVFSFFANTVLPEIHRELLDAGYLVSVYKGGSKDNEKAKQEFKEGRTEILLASDAAARGVNLENAEYVIEYESATTFANREQRLNRIHRISSALPSITCVTAILENTIEDGLVDLMLSRNRAQDTLLGDEDDGSAFMTAAQRRRLLKTYHDRRRKK